MIFLKTSDEIELLRQANLLVGKTLAEVANLIEPGATTRQLDKVAEEFIRDNGAIPTFKGYPNYDGTPFPGSICASVNDEVVHGIPSKRRTLCDGDIISIDMGCILDGWHSDAARTFAVGKISDEAQRLIDTTKQSFFEGISVIKHGVRLGDVSNTIQTFLEERGYGVVRDLVGHGIGRALHEEPEVPNFGSAGRGVKLAAGMTLAIEPMVTMGNYRVGVLDDDWTVVTADGSLAAHYENTVLVTHNGCEILTL